MLTDAGMDLITVMEVMCAWGTKYLGGTPTLPRIPQARQTPAQAQ